MVKEQITPQAVKEKSDLDFSKKEKGTALSHDDIKFYQTMENGVVHFEYMHYEMPLPFKHQDLQLSNNYKREKRLNSLKKCPVFQCQILYRLLQLCVWNRLQRLCS